MVIGPQPSEAAKLGVAGKSPAKLCQPHEKSPSQNTEDAGYSSSSGAKGWPGAGETTSSTGITRHSDIGGKGLWSFVNRCLVSSASDYRF